MKLFPVPFYTIEHFPIGSMCGIFTFIYYGFWPNVGKYTVRPMDPMGVEPLGKSLPLLLVEV